MDTNKKIENILKLSNDERYEYFIRKVADFEEVWGLNNNGWAMLGDDQENKYFAFWPEREFAELCAIGIWKDYEPKAIDLDSFLERWLPGIEKDLLLTSIFQTPDSKGIIKSAQELNQDINEELAQYE